MKIVIVLCSLATFAIAVPVYQENVFESSLGNQASNIKRERKSALHEITPGLFAEHEIEKIPIHSSKKSGQGTSLEAKSFRRPIIIKRKLGYHVYRDSDEEMAYAEPGEKCREQVKFKLCDHEPVSSSKSGFKSPTFKCLNSHSTDNEMGNSIKMAKEAVVHLQKDLKRMENFSPKMVNPNIEDIESNTGLHHDIEIAREALEHIEQNFESVNLEVNKVKDLQIPKSQDEERLTRWREAIENIHKNFAIVKNIEDAFKSDNHLSLLRSDSIKAVESEEPEHSEGQVFVQHKFTNDNLEKNDEVYNEDKILKSASSEDGIVQRIPKTEDLNNIGKDAGNDMYVFPTENKEEKILHSDSLKSEINFKDTSLRSDVREIESTKHETNVPKESIEYALRNSNSLPESNPESKSENSPLERPDFMPKSTTIESSKNSEAGEEEIKYSDKYNHKEVENKSKSYNTNMRLSNDQLEKTEQLSANNFKYTDEYKNTKSSEIQDGQIGSRMSQNQELNKLSFLNDDSLKTVDQKEPQLYKTVSATSKEYTLNDRNKFAKKYSTEEEMGMIMTQNKDANEDPKWKFSKSDPVLYSDPMLSIQRQIEDKSDDQHSYKSQANMRLSQTQTGELQSNEYNDGAEQASSTFGIEYSPDDPKTQLLKSVPELQPYPKTSLPTDKEDITNDQQSYGEESNIRASENLNEKMQSNQNQEVHEPLPIGLDIERHPEENTWKFPKSVPELPFDLMVSMPKEKVDITDNQHAHKEEVNMRSSENQNDKMLLNENQEVHEPLTMGLDFERHPEERTWQYSVPELSFDQMSSALTEKVDITEDQHAYKGEESMRSSENQNDKMIFNNDQEMPEPLPIGLDTERYPEERTWQLFKSVPDLPFDPMPSTPTEKVDIADDQHVHKGEESMRTSENQNDKMQSYQNQEMREPLSTGLDIERHSEERSEQYSKSVPELQLYPKASLSLDITNDRQSHNGEASMKSAEITNEENKFEEIQEVPLAMGLDIKHHPEERTWQLFKSVPELPYNPMVPIPGEKVDITDNQHAHKGEGSMRSSESQSEKSQLNINQEDSEHAAMILNIENNSDNSESQFFKSVPELQLYPIPSLPSNKVDITNDQQSYIEEASVRSSETQNDKMQSNEYKEVHESLSMGSDFERHPDERTWQYSKSVPELPNDPMVSMATDKIDITDHEHALKEEESMRSSENQNDKMQLNVYQDKPEHASTTLNIENNSDNTKTQFLKSASELQPTPTDKVHITNDKQSLREEASMRSSESQNENMQSNENQEVHEPLPMALDIERHPEERTWQDSKSVPELSYDPIVSRPTEQVDITDDQHVPKEEERMRSSENQNDKLELNVYQDKPEHASTTLSIENNFDDKKTQFMKSASELQPMPTDKVDFTNDQQSHREEATMRSSESQNENQEVREPLPTVLDIERHSEERTWQDSKSVPELSYDSIVSRPTEQVDITDDQHVPKDKESMRSSENQNDKMELSVYQDKPEHASTTLSIENNSDDKKTQFMKSASELQAMPTDKVVFTNDQQSHREEATMRSSESQNENQEVREPLPTVLDIERHTEERTWQDSKSVPELSYDSIVSRPTEQVDITDDQHVPKEEESMRSSENQNDKMELSVYQDKPEHPSTTLSIENNSDDKKTQFMKSASELQPMPTDKVDFTNDQQSHREEATMRSSESQNENQEVHEPLPTVLDIERHSEERTWQDSKSVPELSYDSIVSRPTEQVDITDDQHVPKEEESMRSSENQNDKMELSVYQDKPEHPSTTLSIENNSDDKKTQFMKSASELQPMPTDKVDFTNDQQSHREEATMRSSESQNENQEVHEPLPTVLDIEPHSEERTWQDSKSVPELSYDSIVSRLTEQVDITDDQHAHKGEVSIKTAENQNDKIQSNENQELPTIASGLDIERHPEERNLQYSKSVPELSYDAMISMPTEKVDITDDQHAHKGEESMRSSDNQNNKMQSNENQEVYEPFSTGLDIERHPEERSWQYSKSVPELQLYPIASLPVDKVDITNDQQAHSGETSIRMSENQNFKKQSTENQEVREPLSTGLDIERHPEERIEQYSKSVPELTYDSIVSGKVDIINDQYYKGDTSMRVSETQNDKFQLNDHKEEPLQSSTRFVIENDVENQKSQVFKTVPELNSDPSVSLPTWQSKVDINKEKAGMRLTQAQNEKLQLNEFKETHEPLIMRLDMTNQPEEQKWKFSKSVPELPYDPMVSMPTDKIEIIDEQHSLNEGNMRLSQNQNERTQFQESRGLQDFFPTKLGIENHPENNAPQFFKSEPELYMTRSNINHANNENFYFPEDSRLAQNQNERQQIYFNQHYYEPLSSRLDEKKLEDDSLSANKVRFSYIPNLMKEQTNMRLSQNENENKEKEIQYSSTSFGLSKEHMNRDDNAEHIMNDNMHRSLAQQQQLHENRNSMPRSSNERQHLNYNYNSWPEYKMLPSTSQFEYRNGHLFNEHPNMRINEQQSRAPEPIENQNLHNSLSILWNTENQHQDPSSKTFKSNLDFDHTLHKSNEYDSQQFIPHEVSKPGNSLEYRTRAQLFGDHILDDTQSSRWYQTNQHNDHFANYYKTIPEVHEEHMNPQFRKHLHRVAVNHKLNDADTFSSYDFPSSSLHDHMQKYHQEKSSNIDSSMEPGMNMNMREPFAKSGTEFNNMHFNNPHGTPRFGAGLPIAGVNSGAMGVFPTANAGGCGIPLLLSCSPSVVSGSLARQHIVGPVLKSVDENFKYYMKRDAKNIVDVPDIKIHKAPFPHHGTGATSEILNS